MEKVSGETDHRDESGLKRKVTGNARTVTNVRRTTAMKAD